MLAVAVGALGLVAAASPARAATPVLATQASASGFPAGGAIFDTATLGQGLNPTGTITFDLFGPGNTTCSGPPLFTSVIPVNGNGFYQSGFHTTNQAGTYQWVARYSGDANNTPVATACNDPAETVTMGRRIPTLVTQATLLTGGQLIMDTATLGNGTGPAGPTGTITFNLFGPNNLVCAGPPIFVSVKPVSGNGVYPSDSFLAPAAGTYQWIAQYSGDANNFGATTICADPAEAVVVLPGLITPQLTTLASPTVPVGGQVTDQANLSGGVAPTGTITFRLFGPDNPTCTGAPAASSTRTVTGNGTYTSDPVTPAAPGTYRWVATYSGDVAHNGVVTACNDPVEAVVVTPIAPVQPVLVTQASPGVPLGGQVTDTATLSGGNNPTGTITFDLFGPNIATCTGTPTFTSMIPVAGNGSYTSGAFIPTAPGTYRWIARYSGDANHTAVATACNDPAESVVISAVGPVTPTLVTQASPGGVMGQPLTDTATLGGGSTPTGTITFTLFGPDDATCSTAVFTSAPVPVNGNGAYTSPPFSPTAPGTYRWRAAYSGDVNHNAVATACNDPLETVTVTSGGSALALTTTASPAVPVGGQLTDTATLSGGTNPTGTVTFNLFGPDDATCSAAPRFTSVKPVSGAGSYVSDPFTATAAGVYRWVAIYSGDANNASVSTVCGDPAETVTVTAAAPGQLAVSKTASPATLPAPGGEFTFTVSVSNPGGSPLAITGMTDDVHGNLTTRPGSTCTTAPGAIVQPGGPAYTCSFTGSFTGVGGATQTDTVTVSAMDSGGNPLVGTDSATVAITNAVPQILVDKHVLPPTRPEPGGTFDYGIIVTNVTVEPLVLTTLVDNVYGNLNGRGTCANGATLAASGGTYVCNFSAPFTGNAGASQTDTVTATAVNSAGTTATATDNATISLTNVAPLVSLVHTVTPATLPEEGGTFTHTVTVTNTGTEGVRIVSLVSLFGDLATRPGSTCGSGPGSTLAPGTAFTCTFTAILTGEAGATQSDTVAVTVVDDEGTSASASSSVTVSLTDVPPKVEVDLSITPQSRPEPGGSFTYTVTVRNTSNPETVTLTSLVSDVHGNLDGRGTCRVNVVLPPVPAAGSTFTCSFTATFTGPSGARQVTRITGTVVDNEGMAATATSEVLEGTIVITDAPPTVPPTVPPPTTVVPSLTPVPKAPGPAIVFTGSNTWEPLRLSMLLVVIGLALTQGSSRRRGPSRPPSASVARAALLGAEERQRGRNQPAAGMGLGGSK